MPTPTPEQIESTREVLGLNSYSDAQGRIESLEEAQWDAQLVDNGLYADEKDGVDIGGSNALLGAQISVEETIGRIRNRSRLRFGLPALTGTAGDYAANGGNELGFSSLRWY